MLLCVYPVILKFITLFINFNAMKTFSALILFFSFAISMVSAQNNSPKKAEPFTVDAVTPPNHQTGSTNYTLANSEQDYKNGKYVFCTDSNATVAYLTINGFTIRLAGGPNPENILAYTGKDYTVTLSISKTNSNKILDNADDYISVKVDATLVIYNGAGKVVGKKVTGEKINAVKN
jgi:hypothetical protein